MTTDQEDEPDSYPQGYQLVRFILLIRCYIQASYSSTWGLIQVNHCVAITEMGQIEYNDLRAVTGKDWKERLEMRKIAEQGGRELKWVQQSALKEV